MSRDFPRFSSQQWPDQINEHVKRGETREPEIESECSTNRRQKPGPVVDQDLMFLLHRERVIIGNDLHGFGSLSRTWLENHFNEHCYGSFYVYTISPNIG